jgi:hypothetical protein
MLDSEEPTPAAAAAAFGIASLDGLAKVEGPESVTDRIAARGAGTAGFG